MVKRRTKGSRHVWAILGFGLIAGAAAFSAGYTTPESQVAVGAAADMQCTGDYDPRCEYPNIHPQSRKRCLIGKPCEDVTSGHVTKGTCREYGKCLGQQTGGMMPMLPMLPMPMPSMGGAPSVPDPCPAPKNGTTTASTTQQNQFGVPCPSQQVSPLSGYLFGSGTEANRSADTQNESGSVWGNLLDSLLGTTESETGEEASNTSGAAAETEPTESGFFAGLRRGVQTIVRITTATPAAPTTGVSATNISTSQGSGYVPSESTFVSTNASEASQQSVIATIQNTLAQLGGALRNFLSSLTK